MAGQRGEVHEATATHRHTAAAAAAAAVVPKPKRRGLATLFTHEDVGNMHKTLGALAMAHFVYRFARMARMGVAGVADDMGFDGGSVTLVCIGLHALLSVSSLIFRIPARRIKEGTRIWPQVRAVALG